VIAYKDGTERAVDIADMGVVESSALLHRRMGDRVVGHVELL